MLFVNFIGVFPAGICDLSALVPEQQKYSVLTSGIG